MNIQNAKNKLEDSLSNLKRMKGQLNTADIEADIMNVACFELLNRITSYNVCYTKLLRGLLR